VLHGDAVDRTGADAGLLEDRGRALVGGDDDVRRGAVGDDVDDIRGILYFKDLVSRWEATGGQLDMRAEQMMRPAEFAADTYTKPELPEAAKENSERGAEAAAEHYLALMVYAWNTGDTQPFADMSNETDDFHQNVVTDISNVYAHGWSYDNKSEIVHILQVNPIDPNGSSIPPNTISIAFLTKSSDGITCRGQKVNTSTTEYETVLTLLLTWHDGKWIVTQGTTVNPDA